MSTNKAREEITNMFIKALEEPKIIMDKKSFENKEEVNLSIERGR